MKIDFSKNAFNQARRQKQSAKNTANKLAKVSRKVNRLVSSIETKHYKDTEYVTNVNTTPYIFPMNDLVRGDDDDLVIGRKATFTKLQVYHRFLKDSGIGTNYVKFFVIQDKQCNAAAPAYTDIWDYIDGNFRNNDQMKRFNILYQYSFTLDAVKCQETNVQKTIKLRNIQTHYDAGGVGFAGISKNSIFGVLWSNQAGTDGCYGSVIYELSYTDL